MVGMVGMVAMRESYTRRRSAGVILLVYCNNSITNHINPSLSLILILCLAENLWSTRNRSLWPMNHLHLEF
jgi:hypothetical protein